LQQSLLFLTWEHLVKIWSSFICQIPWDLLNL